MPTTKYPTAAVLGREVPLRRVLTLAAVLVVALAGLSTSGCGGCQKADDAREQAANKEKKKKKKPDFQVGDLETVPSDRSQTRNFVKPGHYVAASVEAVANNFDFRAEMVTAAVDRGNQPILVPGTRYHVVTARPAILPKGQTKYLESTYFIPRGTGRGSKVVFLRQNLSSARGGASVYTASQLTKQMPGYQYLFLVLAANPNAYGYLKQLESVSPPYDELLDEGDQLLYYRVVLPSADGRVPLPAHPLAWTDLAYILWDSAAPHLLTTGQQQSMLDWLHWGGQLIISGPGSLDALKGSFLAPYLPVMKTGTVPLGPEAVARLNEGWSLRSSKKNTPLALNVTEGSPLVGVQWQLQPGGEYLAGTGQLVAEGRVGRGRIVVTAFGLTGRNVVNWGSYDSFFNACLLRRPPRKFYANKYGAPAVTWSDYPARTRDPLVSTATRYFSRDAGKASSGWSNPVDDWHLDGCLSDADSGVGGWNDKSGVSEAAHTILQEAAGISIPTAGFVLGVLTIYLLVLVPLNWGIFRLLGRVEWAWAAAPVIAFVGAAAVIRLAQLDIGFVRSRTEVATLEVQGGFTQAHLTRYTALYTSLASAYELTFDHMSAVSRPFTPTTSPDTLWEVTFRRDRDVRLSNFQVKSNQTGFLHSEQMLGLDGTIELRGSSPRDWRVRNSSSLTVDHVGIIHRMEDGDLNVAWVGRLASQTTVPISWKPSSETQAWLDPWAGSGNASAEPAKAAIDLTRLIRIAAQGMELRAGDVRLIGWIAEDLPGLTISPAASQTTVRTLVVVHLRYGPWAPPRPDVNVLADLSKSGDSGEKSEEANDAPPLAPDANTSQESR